MAATPERLKAQIAEVGRDLDRSDIWLFGPLIAIVVAMPLAIVTLMGAGLWFAASHSDLTIQRPPTPDTFASRWVEPAKPETVIR